jgi:hypothetical protein
MSGIRWLGSVVVAAVLVVTASASAQESSDDQRARLHFEAGRSYFEEGDYEQALDEFSRAYALSHRAVLLVNIANCQERLGRWTEAADSLGTFRDSLPPEDDQRATLARRIENLRARALEHQETTTTTTTDAGAGTTAAPTGAETTTTTTTSSASGGSDGLLIPAVIALGVGGASLIAWGVLGGMALGEESAVASGCGATVSCTPAQVQTMDDLALGADIAMVVGLVGVATGVVLFLVDPPRGAASDRASRGPTVAPYAGRDGAGAAIAGSF